MEIAVSRRNSTRAGGSRLLFGWDEQDDHFERKVKEHHARIDVLGDVAARTRQFGRDAENIGFVDETGEIAREIFFALREVVELRQMEIVDKVFAQAYISLMSRR